MSSVAAHIGAKVSASGSSLVGLRCVQESIN